MLVGAVEREEGRGGFLPGAANFFCQPVYAFPLAYGPMPPQHRQDGRRGRSGGGGEPPPHAQEQQQQQHSSLQSMDALKARILEAAPGEVKGIITASTVVPRAAAFTSLIQMAAKTKQPAKAIEIFEAMTSVGVQPNTFSYSALISALARAGRWQEAERYFDELLAKARGVPELAPNTVTYAALISAYEKGGQLEKALSAFRQQLHVGVSPDLITYSSLITACERAGNLGQAAELLDQLHSAGLVGHHQLYHGLLQACQVAGEWELALEVFLSMQCATAKPTSHTVGLLLGALVAAGQRAHALCLLREALAAGYDVPTPAFNNLLRLLAGVGDWERALGVFRAMQLSRARPDATSAGLLVAACVQGGNQGLAAQVAADLAAQGLLPPAQQQQQQQQPGNGKSQGGLGSSGSLSSRGFSPGGDGFGRSAYSNGFRGDGASGSGYSQQQQYAGGNDSVHSGSLSTASVPSSDASQYGGVPLG